MYIIIIIIMYIIIIIIMYIIIIIIMYIIIMYIIIIILTSTEWLTYLAAASKSEEDGDVTAMLRGKEVDLFTLVGLPLGLLEPWEKFFG